MSSVARAAFERVQPRSEPPASAAVSGMDPQAPGPATPAPVAGQLDARASKADAGETAQSSASAPKADAGVGAQAAASDAPPPTVEPGSRNRSRPAIATMVSSGDGATIARPVIRPNAGRIARRRPSTKQGRRTRLVAASGEADARMHVAAERVAGARRRGGMAREERRQRVRLADDVDAPALRRVAGVRVVVAAHERDRERRMRVAPGQERRIERGDDAGLRVQEVAEHDQTLRAARVDERGQAREIGGGRAARHRHAAGAERRGLAQVHVGDEQRAHPRPQERPLGEELHRLVADRRRQAVGLASRGGEVGGWLHRRGNTGSIHVRTPIAFGPRAMQTAPVVRRDSNRRGGAGPIRRPRTPPCRR